MTALIILAATASPFAYKTLVAAVSLAAEKCPLGVVVGWSE